MTLKSKVVCNIPHSGVLIPDWGLKDFKIPDEELFYWVSFMVDKDVDKIWSFVNNSNKVVSSISRLVVDMERYRDDKDESMFKLGMGLYYTHSPFGKEIRDKSELSYNKCLDLYDKYHRELEDKVTACLNEYNECILLDCHSFHDAMTYTGYDAETFPDICIGVNGEMFKEAELVYNIFTKEGYSVKINEPFSGALIPLRYLYDKRVKGIMIELNRKIYNDIDTFNKVVKLCKKVYESLS